jgi:hypothetical protein
MTKIMEQAPTEMETLANGIDFALRALNKGTPLEFALVLVKPAGDGHVTLNTITGITDCEKIATIGQHLIDMARAQMAEAGGLDEFNDDEIQGHA